MAEKYSYGRHETFPVRYGWLTKGLRHAAQAGTLSADLGTADALGLGSKMVKSLQFWMEATGLMARENTRAKGSVTDFGQAVLECDADLELPGTWYFLHAHLAQNPGSVWFWFFNHYPERVFDRANCIQAFIRFTKEHARNPASPAVAEKDVGCMILAYATPSTGDVSDPEDASASPLRELRLLNRNEGSERLERGRASHVPMEAVLACASAMAGAHGVDSVSYRDLANSPGGPGRVFSLSGETLEQSLDACVAANLAGQALLGDERHLVVGSFDTSAWLRRYYTRMGAM